MSTTPNRTDGPIYILGNSQLMFSVVAAYGSEELYERCQQDWRDLRITEGELVLDDGPRVEFLSCNMWSIWPPEHEAAGLTCPPGLTALLDRVDAEAATIITMLRGNGFAYEALIDAPPQWDFLWRAHPTDPERVFAQWPDVSSRFDQSNHLLLAAHEVIRRRFPDANVLHVPPPPPLDDGSEHLGPAGLQSFAELADVHGIRPFAQRRKIYEAMYARFQQCLDELDIPTVDTPAEAITPDGALIDEYAADCVHGNARYGRALMRQIQENHLHASLQESA